MLHRKRCTRCRWAGSSQEKATFSTLVFNKSRHQLWGRSSRDARITPVIYSNLHTKTESSLLHRTPKSKWNWSIDTKKKNYWKTLLIQMLAMIRKGTLTPMANRKITNSTMKFNNTNNIFRVAAQYLTHSHSSILEGQCPRIILTGIPD